MKRFKYPLMVILSAVMYGLAPALGTFTFRYGGNGMSVAFFTTLSALPFLYGIVKKQRQTLHLEPAQIKKVLLLSSLGSALTIVSLFFAYEYISIGLATTLHFIYPIVVTLAMVLLYRQKLGVFTLCALLMAVGGIAVISLDEANAGTVGISAALLSGLTWAFYIIYLDRSGLKDLNAYVVAFYCVGITCAASGLVALLTGRMQPFISPIAWLFVLLAGLVGRVLAGPCFQSGIRGTGPLTAGILSTFEPITSVIAGILLFADPVSWATVMGCALVIAGVCWVVYADSHRTCEPQVDIETPMREPI